MGDKQKGLGFSSFPMQSKKNGPDSQLAQMGYGFMGGGLGGVYGRSSGHSTSIGKRHLKSEEDYFEQEDEIKNEEDLEYLPAPGSPSYGKKAHGEQSSDSDSDDPLEAFMSGIEKEVKDLSELDKKKAQGKDAEKDKNVRDDIEEEDEQESYFRYMEENPNAGVVADDDEIIDYDEDGNPIFVNKKVIIPLDPIDHSEIEYEPFNKNFYEEHEEISKLTQQQVQELLNTLGLKVSGLMPVKPVSSFAHFQFDEALMKAIRKAGYTQPTAIQAQAVPIALSGRDIIGIAKTGSGKTAAYLWPLLVHIMDQRELQPGEGPIGLICAPTRELSQQIYHEAKKFGKVLNFRVVCAYGGGSLYEQCKACEEGAEIIVATPGRLIDLIKKKATNFKRVTFVVFDEADRMFDMGFEPQVRSIASNIRPDRQTLMFSATFRKKVERVARDILSDPIRVIQGELGEANEDITQIVKVLPLGGAKWQWLIGRLVEFTSTGSVLIFVTKKANSVELANNLKLNDFKVALMHGDMNQVERNEVINAFRKKEYPILIATDVAARGLDIPHIKTVINFDVARDIDTHVHRIGRTGRAGEKGTAYTLVTNKDKEFAGHLVRNLEAANQFVPQELMELAQQNPWFKKTRFKQESARKPNIGGRGLGYKDKGQKSGGHSGSFSSSHQGPQGDRVASMKVAFMQQYKTNFIAASAEGGGRNTMQYSSPHVDDVYDKPAAIKQPVAKPTANQVPGLKGILYSSNNSSRSNDAQYAMPPPSAANFGQQRTGGAAIPPPSAPSASSNYTSGLPSYMKGFVTAANSSQPLTAKREEEPSEKKRKKSRWADD